MPDKKNLSEPGTEEGEFTRAKCVLGSLILTSCEKELNLEFTVRLLRQFTHHLN